MPDIAAIYFPSWHVDPRREHELGAGWTEWDLVRAGVPRFDGHHQPIEPLWGEVDEAEPAQMARVCELARGAGIDAFLWDWYWYDDDRTGAGDYLNRPLDEAYLGLDSPGVAFALMWANHDWRDVFPARTGVEPALVHPGAVSPDAFRHMCRIVIDRYLTHPSHWRIRGAAWFTVYRLDVLIEGLGGDAATRRALAWFRDAARAAGAGPLHLNCLDGWQRRTPAELAGLGIDSVGHYNWSSVLPLDQGLEIDYAEWRDAAVAQWSADRARLPALGYVPNVTMGWDSSARVSPQDELVITDWPHLPIVIGNTPEEFGRSCRAARDFAAATGADVITVNAWNEWTEGSYLEPDRHHGYAYLDALRAVFGPPERT